MSAVVRDRSIDAVRAWAIVGVVAGHWLVTGLVPGPDGVTTASPLSAMPAAAPATWLFQTLGLLFFAGGYAATHRAGRTDHKPTVTVRGPRARIVRPALVLLAGWALLVVTGAALGTPTATLHTATSLILSPLWFLLPYLVLSAATAPLRRVLHRVGLAATALPLIATVAAVDLGLLPGPAALLAAWAVPWLLGTALAERDRRHGRPGTGSRAGTPARTADPWIGAALACNGAAVLAGLVLVAGYPVSAVGVPGDGRSNLDPPSLAAVALAVTQIGVFLLLRGPVTRLLHHPRAWAPVAALNRLAVPVYLGHQSVLLAVAGAAALLNPTMPGLLTAPDGPAFLWCRLAWLPVLAGLLAVSARGVRPASPITLGTA